GAAEDGFWAAVDRGDVAELATTLGIADDRLSTLLPALADWRRRERADSAVSGWRYRIAWAPVADTAGTLAGSWLVAAGSVHDELTHQVVRALTERGARVVLLPVGADELDRTDLADRIRTLSLESPFTGVVSLLALDEDRLPDFPAVPRGLAATALLAQSLADVGSTAALWALTRGAVSTGPGDQLTHPLQGQVWGFGRVAALELPDRWGGLIDLPQQWDERVATRLVAALASRTGDAFGSGSAAGSGSVSSSGSSAPTAEDQIAIRPAGVLARRLVHAPAASNGTEWTPRGSVLITGGTGGIGGHTARWLAGRGAPRVVLTSRSGATAAGAVTLAAELAGLGTAVDIMACDVAARPQVAALLQRTAATGPALSAVIHAAGVSGGGTVLGSGPADLAEHLAAKADGATWLDELTEGLELEAFVVFSSGAAVWGSGSLAGYAAANAHLDAVVDHRAGRGLPGTSIAWGLWGGGGMVSGEIGEQLQRYGMRAMDSEPGIRALAQVLDGDGRSTAVADVDWDKFAPTFTLRRPSPLISGLPEVRRALAEPEASASGGQAPRSQSELAARLVALSELEQTRHLVDLVRGETAAVLGYPSPEAVEAERAFRELGIDSVTAVELRNRLNAATGLRLPSTLVFDYPSAASVADFLRAELIGTGTGTASAYATGGIAAADDPIAIVAMGCKIPGGVGGPEQFWELLANGVDAVGEFPTDRGWDVMEEAYWASLAAAGADTDIEIAHVGGFVYDAGEFDAGFFGISPREALAMDPQQRMLLEVSWETIERAGLNPHALRGSRTGVFAGATYSGYGAGGGLDSGSEGYMLTGSLTAVISGRVSYTLGLEGPAVTVDTACSSSLVALHLACQSLRSGECEMALAGGVAVLAVPGAFAEFSKQQGMSTDGRSKAFSADADGIGWGEGAGMLLLERESDARRNGHPVLAVIKGSAMNQDGASNGLSAPNGPSQQRVIRAALAGADLTPDDIDIVEAHGTGTSLGDPIEAHALLATYGRGRPDDKPLWLGSVKSNIGHLQTASGVISIMKMVLAMQHAEMPRTLHAEVPSPHIDWAAGNVRLLQEARPWPRAGQPRRAGVSAFGISGTNVHVIVEEAAAVPAGSSETTSEDEARDASRPPVLATTDTTAWPVSARSHDALAAQAGRLREFALAHADQDPADIAWSLATTRSVFEHRAVAIGADRGELAAGLAAVATGQPAAGVVTGVAPSGGAGRSVFVFPGQGSQWVGMGRELLATSPVFAARFAECAEALAPFVDWSLYDLLDQRLETADQVQPVLWAMMVSLAAVWQAAGVTPDAVVGHSQGEIAAAVVAGILSLEDGARVVALRSQALKPLAGKGGMLSLALPADAVRERIAAFGDRASIAAINGASATVVSGEPGALLEIQAAAEADEIRARMIPVDYASHSAQIDALQEEILRVLAGVTPGGARVPMLSAMSGEQLSGPEMDASYWYASLRSTVEFDRAIRALADGGHQVFIEVSPHPVLTGAITDTLEDRAQTVAGPDTVVLGTLRRDEGGPARLLASLAEAHVRGVGVDWSQLTGPAETLVLPTYAFQREHYWAEAAAAPVATTAATESSEVEARFWAAVEQGDLGELADTLALDASRPLNDLLPALASWRRRERADSAVADWRYRVSWVPLADPPTAILTGTWLVVAPHAGLGDGLLTATRTALGDRGADVAILEVSPDDLDRSTLAARLASAVSGPVAGIVSLLAFDERPVPGFPAVSAGVAGSLLLVQALGDARIEARTWSLTSGAVGVHDRPGSLVQSEVWGLGRVAGLEHLDRWGGLIDLPAVWDDRTAGRLCAALADGTEDQLAIRATGTVARRVVRAKARRTAGDWTPSGTVLVTGATGKIGPYVADWLTARGAERVVLTSRSGPAVAGAEAQVAELVAGMAGRGTGVSVLACDITDRDDVAGLLAHVTYDDGPPLKHVLHTANAGRMVSFDGTDLRDLDIALGAKASGAVWLDELTRDLDLEDFVLFSSIAAMWGSAEHAAYAAGNAFLDALAEDRRGRGLPATSVAWGVWDTQQWSANGAELPDGPGVVTPARLARQGMNFLAPDRALTALGQVLADDETFIAVADVDWTRFAPVFSAMRHWPLFDGLPEVRKLAAAAPREQAAVAQVEGELANRLLPLSPAERERVVTDLVRTHAAAVLGHSSADAVSAGRAFRDLGFESLTAVELRNRLNAATGLNLPSTVVFDYPSPTVLARQIITQLLGASQSSAAQQPVARSVLDEPVAVIGMGCRFPGGVSTPDELWSLLATGGDAISGFPTDRGWDMAGLYDPDPDNPGTSYVQEGGFLQSAAEFDAPFFGISPREALAMDPQQRLLLETSWEALERAGIDPETLRGTLTGVFAGASPSGYAAQVIGAVEGAEGHLISGNATSVLSGRVSYTLGLEGPAVTVDTACSSSLVALHLAAQALRNGECTMAIAGGVMVMADSAEFVGFSRQRALAADGRCKAFSDDADGMGIAEGAGMVILERVSDAQRNGHAILAVIRGSAINQDGASNGLTAPNGPSQQRVIRAALASARLSSSEVDAVEAHGTGTTLGDPIEAQALLATYGQDRTEDKPLWLGSVKSNIGHAQQAAGIAGVIKTVLALQHELLPATLYAEEPSTHVDWTAGHVRLLNEPVAWPRDETRPRRAGVSAFGLSGTNAHVIVEEAPAYEAPEEEGSVTLSDLPVLETTEVATWLISSRTAEGLADQATRLRAHALAHPELEPLDIGWSLATSRTVFQHRAVVTGTDRDVITDGLAAMAAGRPDAGVTRGAAPASGPGRTVFVFPGQGGQWVGMGKELLESSPVFAARFAECAAALAPHLDWSVRDVVSGAEGAPALEAAEVVQPVLWAMMVSLAAVWQAAGVDADAVVGHSQGEIAAACVAGILSLEDAARVVALRSQSLRAIAGIGGMLSLAEPADRVRERLAAFGDRVSVAAVNGPAATVVSGEPAALRELQAIVEAEEIRARMIPVDYASHSAHVDALRDEILRVLAGITPCATRIPMISAMSGEWLTGPEMDADYWYASLRATVEFDRAIRGLSETGHQVFIEVSPHPVVTGALADTLDAVEAAAPVVTGTLRRDDGGPARLIASLAQAWTHGAAVDWTAVLGRGQRVDLPTYAFQRQRYWPEPKHQSATVVAGSPAEAGFWAAVEDGDIRQLADTLAVGDEQLTGLLPALASWRRREREDNAVADWRYKATWTPVTDSGSAALTGTWLAVVPVGFADAETTVDVLRTLRDRGAEVTTLEIGPADLDRTALAARLEDAAYSGVVSLLALDESPVRNRPVVHTAVAASLVLVQALGDAGITAPLWALTRGAVSTGAGDPLTSIVQAQVWGLGRVVALEHGDRWGGLIDLPATWDERIAARFGAALTGTEDQLAVRATGTLARRLVRAPQPPETAPWIPSGSVLITGGTGGIGGHTARWLADRGAPRLVLTSRSGAGAAGVAALAAEVAAKGARVDVVACDMASRSQVASLLDGIGDLVGVIHSAGVGEATAIGEFTLDHLEYVSAVKTAGATWLDELTGSADLEAFVVFSSVSATWGSGLQPGYAAANAFLDALAEDRRARGLAATSVAWGLWDGGGMGSGDSADQLQRYGLRLMDPALGIRGLAQAVDGGEVAVSVADVDWERFAPTFTMHRPSPLLETVPEAQRALAVDAEPVAAESQGELVQRLAGQSRGDQERLLSDLVRGEAAAVLGYASADAIEPERAFKDLGVDSVTAVELRNRLNAATGLRLSSTLVFDYPNPAILATHLREQLAPEDGGPASIFDELGRLESALAELDPADASHQDVTRRLQGILSRWIGTRDAGDADEESGIDFESASSSEVFDFLDNEFGLS
ncbi:MAG: SDR family NAD(P)-dependent oxidoreductase, partial [Catenulispora sp.]|nr:SDR family NAD(P)-dependent oxidoreductase [Catenulispora sp.]